MKLKIGDFEIGSGRAFIIAEIGNNHNGDIKLAKKMVDQAITAGADCVKFQMRQLDSVYRQRSLTKTGEDLGTEYIIDLLKKFELSVDQQKEIAEYCAQNKILYLCTPWDTNSVDVLVGIGVPAFKVASADLTNLPLLDHMISTGKPLILSTGMSKKAEIIETVEFLKKRKALFVLLHCNSTYPAPLHDINLRWMSSLRELHPLVGYSGHERGINVSIGAAALDACVIERHFTLDRKMEGPDHAASLVEDEFTKMVSAIREVEQSLGHSVDRYLSQGEMINRENLAKSLVAAVGIESGTTLRPEHIKVRSPGQGLSPQFYDKILGVKLKRDLKPEDFFFPSDLEMDVVGPRNYEFSRPWGVPIRYHDFNDYNERVQPDLWEFHLSYSDMDLNIDDYISGPYAGGFVVHAPELFSNSMLMDLTSDDEVIRRRSVWETQRVVDITKKLRKHFSESCKPLIVANVGGFSMDRPISAEEIDACYERLTLSLGELDLNGVELIPQTMAPFPWHFGGQRFQNLFLKPDDIVKWSSKLNLRICLDVSHSYLCCNHFGLDFYDFVKVVAPWAAHIHMGDARGLNGEGLQIGEGDIDFYRLGKILKSSCPDATFIPEIWQGHKNGGEGFWLALERLEGSL